ncbi:AAA family ATPase [Streptomyces bambusae]|uniref:AAA family ATPase n=1 Tax=Streptomyces bambusae TaxID=1550616 RepID=UPI001CFD8072|nr:AAA family ATPase [Streptomyces bambusae]MCB5168038.1 AAA family ATPase [Streptomyces bambusae]
MDNVRRIPHQQADHDGLNRRVPYDPDAENLVAGVIMHNADAFNACAQIMKRDDLYLRHTQLIWDVVAGMVAEGKQLHPVLVKNEIQRLDRLGEVNGGLLIDRLGCDVISGLMAPSFAEEIHNKARLRRHLEHATAIEAAILTGAADPDELDKLATRHAEAQAAPEGASARLTDSLLNWAEFFATDYGSVELLLGGLLAPGQQIAVVGEGKAGKSLFVQEWLWRMASGLPFLGDRAHDPVSVLYVDAENGQKEIQQRLVSYGAGPGRMGLFSYASFPPIRPLDTAAGGQDLLALVRECEAQVVCLDTVSRFISGPENDADTWLALYRHTLLPLKSADIASVRIDHMGKDGERGARGSSAKTQDVDHVWELRSQGGGSLTLKRTHTRTGIGPDSFAIVRHARRNGDDYAPGGTRHVLMTWDTEDAPAAPGTDADIMARLKAHGVPMDAGNRVVRDALAELKIPAGSGRIAEIVRARKASIARSSEAFPDPVPDPVPGNVSRNGSSNGKAPAQTFPGTVAETSGTPPVPPASHSKSGNGEGTPGTSTPNTPLCTVCNTPLHGYRLDRGYTTCLPCDPDTGSHPNTAA